MDPNTGQHQRKNADQIEKREKIFKKRLHAGLIGQVRIDRFLAGVGRRFELGGHRLHLPFRHLQQGAIRDSAARLNQVEGFQIGGGGKDPRSQHKKVDRLIRLENHHVSNRQFGIPHLQGITNF